MLGVRLVVVAGGGEGGATESGMNLEYAFHVVCMLLDVCRSWSMWLLLYSVRILLGVWWMSSAWMCGCWAASFTWPTGSACYCVFAAFWFCIADWVR